MKTITTSTSTETNTSTLHLPSMGLRFGDGFREFMNSAPVLDDEPIELPLVQPTRYLEAVTTEVDAILDRHFGRAQESIARCLSTSLLLAARPSRRSPALSDAINALKKPTTGL